MSSSETTPGTNHSRQGEGAISAFVDSWQYHSGQQVSVVDYVEHAIGEGTDAEAVAYVQLNIDGRRIIGAAFDHDTISASLKAVLSALNRKQSAMIDVYNQFVRY